MALAKPFLKLCVVWHPSFAAGADMARLLFDHFRRDFFENVSGGAGIPVMYRSEAGTGDTVPIGVDFDDSAATAVVVFVEEALTSDRGWTAWVHQLAQQAESAGLHVRVLPIAIDRSATQIGLRTELLRWDEWTDLTGDERKVRLLSDITYQLCRMLRLYSIHIQRPLDDEEALVHYLKKIEIFLSHSKHDQNGQGVATLIRDHLYKHGDFETFFDVFDIPVGLQFDKVILSKVKYSAVVAIHTDSYSSREWCRREIIEAKRWSVPLVVADCISDIDERGFPYLGNVPVVRLEPTARTRADVVVFHLLDEILKSILWRCWVQTAQKSAPPSVAFVPRPPELIMLAGIQGASTAYDTLVYPEPPVGSEEEELFRLVAPQLRLISMLEWSAEIGL